MCIYILTVVHFYALYTQTYNNIFRSPAQNFFLGLTVTASTELESLCFNILNHQKEDCVTKFPSISVPKSL